jgi:hypothetical protein
MGTPCRIRHASAPGRRAPGCARPLCRRSDYSSRSPSGCVSRFHTPPQAAQLTGPPAARHRRVRRRRRRRHTPTTHQDRAHRRGPHPFTQVAAHLLRRSACATPPAENQKAARRSDPQRRERLGRRTPCDVPFRRRRVRAGVCLARAAGEPALSPDDAAFLAGACGSLKSGWVRPHAFKRPRRPHRPAPWRIRAATDNCRRGILQLALGRLVACRSGASGGPCVLFVHRSVVFVEQLGRQFRATSYPKFSVDRLNVVADRVGR